MTASKMILMLVYSMFIIVGPAYFLETNEDQILGKWVDAKNPEKVLLFEKQDDSYTGLSLKDGKVIFHDMIYDSKNNRYAGKLIAPNNGNMYSVTINFVNESAFSFTIKQFIFSKKFTFKKLE